MVCNYIGLKTVDTIFCLGDERVEKKLV